MPSLSATFLSIGEEENNWDNFLSPDIYPNDPYSERACSGLHFDYSCQYVLGTFFSKFLVLSVPDSGLFKQI